MKNFSWHKLVYNYGVMPGKIAEIRKIAVGTHPLVPEGSNEAALITSFLKDRGVDTFNSLLFNDELRQRIQTGEFDLLIALGGDGTMLRAGHLCASQGIPVLGINLGHFGFLTEIRQNNWQEHLERLLQGDYWIENRMMLWAEHWRKDERLGGWDVLNEIVVSRGRTVRPIKLDTSVDSRFLTTYVADGLIAATPTGSTAYALAVGGPILPPELRVILLVPVAPHLSVDRAIVLAEGSTVSIITHTTHDAVLSVDGQPSVDLMDGDIVTARSSDHSVRFVRFQDPGYFYRNLTPHMNQNPSTGNTR